jgi:hypothetical protein
MCVCVCVCKLKYRITNEFGESAEWKQCTNYNMIKTERKEIINPIKF